MTYQWDDRTRIAVFDVDGRDFSLELPTFQHAHSISEMCDRMFAAGERKGAADVGVAVTKAAAEIMARLK